MLSKRPRSGSYSSQPAGTQSGRARRQRPRQRKHQTMTNNASGTRQAYAVRFYPPSARSMYWQITRAFPTNLKIDLRWVQIFSLTTTATIGSGFMALKQFVLNSCEPDAALAGDNPMYFDTLCGGNGTDAPYEFYRVLKSKCQCEIINDNTNGNTVGLFNVSVGKNLTAVTPDASGSLLCMERPQSVTIPNGSGYSSAALRGVLAYVNHAVALGVKDVKDDDSQDLRYDSVPASADQVRIQMAWWPADNTSGVAATLWFKICIVQTYEFFKLNTVVEA